jgi:hypothetical protein
MIEKNTHIPDEKGTVPLAAARVNGVQGAAKEDWVTV